MKALVVEASPRREGNSVALARHLASGAGPTHREWRRLNGFLDLGMAGDDHWRDILRHIQAGA